MPTSTQGGEKVTIELFQHQKEGIAFLQKKKKAILADSMGLGKTRQAIMAAGEERWMGLNDAGILVVCPASLKINWEREIKMIYVEPVTIIQSGSEQAIMATQWIIINYDLLPKYKDQILEMIAEKKIDTIIVDEAHYIKGKKTIRSEATLEVTDKCERVYMLTGTPIMNRPIEMFNLLKAVKHPLSANRTKFAKRYAGAYLKTIPRRDGRVLRFMDETGATNLDELRDMIKPIFLRRTKEEVLDLPDKIISVQICELSKEWQDAYDMAWERYMDWIAKNPEGKNIENVLTAQHLVELGKLKQVCSLSKIDRIADDIENAVAQGEKVIVFTQYTETVHSIGEALFKRKIGHVYLTGQNTSEERQQSVDMFQQNLDIMVFIGNMKASGVGINLTAATIVIFADMEWSPAIHDQCMDRAHRIGQKGTVNVYYYVVKETIEEDIVDILGAKQAVIKGIMEGTSTPGEDISTAQELLKRLSAKLSP